MVPAKAGSREGVRLAVWQTGLDGLKWLDALVEAGHTIDLGGNGYPCYYTARAEHLLPRIVNGPQEAKPTWTIALHDVVTSQWKGKTTIDHAAIDACRLDEWLLVEAWDES